MINKAPRGARATRPGRLSGFAAALFLLAAVGVGAQGPPAREPRPSELFREAQAVGEAARPDAFEFELDGYSYRVASNGAGRRVKGTQTRLFNLRLAGLDEIRRVRFMEYEGNVLLLCTLDYGDGEGGYVYRLEQPSMRALWSRDVPSLNVEAVREGAALYLAGYSFVGKLDLRTGAYAWQHGELVEGKKNRIPPTQFGRPDVTGAAVVIRETSPPAGASARTFRVHKKSGKILGVE